MNRAAIYDTKNMTLLDMLADQTEDSFSTSDHFPVLHDSLDVTAEFSYDKASLVIDESFDVDPST